MEDVIATYLQAWNETDRARRRELLAGVWAEHGTYQDPTASLTGAEELVQHIGRFHEQRPGSRFELGSRVDRYADDLRFRWRLLDSEGVQASEGTDFVRLTAEGRIASVTGFFGPLD